MARVIVVKEWDEPRFVVALQKRMDELKSGGVIIEDIKYSTSSIPDGQVLYSALVIYRAKGPQDSPGWVYCEKTFDANGEQIELGKYPPQDAKIPHEVMLPSSQKEEPPQDAWLELEKTLIKLEQDQWANLIYLSNGMRIAVDNIMQCYDYNGEKYILCEQTRKEEHCFGEVMHVPTHRPISIRLKDVILVAQDES